MNAVTCQVSAYRYTLMPARAGAAVPSAAAGARPTVRYLSWGSHNSTASAAGTAHTPRASCTEPELSYNGTLSSEDKIAPADSVVR
jgi:hypothetical protein